jgi:hypothetical protein
MAEATALGVSPLATAIASNVSLALTLIGPVNTGDAVVGVVPLVVKKIVAPGVASVIVTDCVPVYVPAAGVKVGVAVTPDELIV